MCQRQESKDDSHLDLADCSMDAHRPSQAVIRLHLWLEGAEGTLFGMGRLQLLERVESCGSIKAAAEELGMSYRAAWGKLKASEEALGAPLVEKLGGNKSGCRLTASGRALAESYRRWFAEVERHALESAADLFPFPCRRFMVRERAASLPVEGRVFIQTHERR
ncbi:molybdate transport system regulatory protein [Humidesulfovibrio mexicanus]|uniref:Molybdate transport system regulatory protein n=1 Tax=Humidesulfovibrio mexicanus TaxID=147047 RepID=A0A238YFT2_9BACT|nr:LysR family transcriptional regulator [Humidesulfovibrio mexicanus]SNR69601.1 molybdate transport system regulatory protein [Humidesulfovibrio mexicanus]